MTDSYIGFSSKLIIHCTPNLSVHIPKYDPQNVFPIGMVTFPPADIPLKIRSASSLLGAVMEMEKFEPYFTVPPHSSAASLPIKMLVVLIGKDTCRILFPSSMESCCPGCGGISLKRPI